MIKVLLADDHIIFRDGIRSILENEKNIEIVGEADDGLKAVKLTEELKSMANRKWSHAYT